MDSVRTARPEELAHLPGIEHAADSLFAELGIGPLPEPGPPEDLAKALVVLVMGEPPCGFARINLLCGGAHLEQLAVHPDHGRRGRGRALLQAAIQWAGQAGYPDITLATYRDIPWNGPFYASEGFVEVGSADAWFARHGLPPEPAILGRFGERVAMRRSW